MVINHDYVNYTLFLPIMMTGKKKRDEEWRKMEKLKDLIPNDTPLPESCYIEISLLWILKMPVLSLRQIISLSFQPSPKQK